MPCVVPSQKSTSIGTSLDHWPTSMSYEHSRYDGVQSSIRVALSIAILDLTACRGSSCTDEPQPCGSCNLSLSLAFSLSLSLMLFVERQS